MEHDIVLYTTADVRRILGIGNKTCLDLFHRSDFPCIKVGKSFKITRENFNKYVSTRRVLIRTNEWKRRLKFKAFKSS